MNYKQKAAQVFAAALGESYTEAEIESLIEKPKQELHGDFAFPCFQLAKQKRKAPQQIAAELAEAISESLFEKAEAVGPYVNVFLNKSETAAAVLDKIRREGASYGNGSEGANQVITMDMSSPNIAKPFSMGHLRSTVIGNSISKILEKSGFQTVKINHLGDWGTQFGKLIYAYLTWGEEEKVRQNTIPELLRLYIHFHEEAEQDPSLEEEGRAWFLKLEQGDTQALELWKWFREASLAEFERIYQLLGVTFDSDHGEAFYNDKMTAVTDELRDKELLSESEGALVVRHDDAGLLPSLIQKRDGATLYTTRDLAAAMYRKATYQFTESLYIVGNEQSLHFKQLKLVLKKMGYNWAESMHHVSFGMILQGGKKMSTRKGKIILLEEVLQQAITLAETNVQEKNPALENKRKAAEMVGVGAVIFHDLKHHRHNDIDFSLEDMLRTEGETGPYVQYTHARACSLLRKADFQPEQIQSFDRQTAAAAWPVISLLAAFPDYIQRARQGYDPSQIAKYVVDLAQAFNAYYGNSRILDDDHAKTSRLAVVYATVIVLKEGLRLLGIGAPERM